MRILVLGKDGQVGWELQRTLAPLGEIIALGRPDLDLRETEAIRRVVRATNPDVIVNAAAYTQVDAAEAEPDLARAVNGHAPGALAEEASRARAALIHFSTDYVFDGRAGRPYVEEDLPNPLSVYGKTKLEGEKAIQDAGDGALIFRTSWVYSLRRPCFLRSVLDWSRQRDSIRVAADQASSPTWCRLVAEATAMILAQARPHPFEFLAERSGIYHLACAGAASRLDWAREILRLDPRADEQRVRADDILAAKSTDFPVPATRPALSALDSTKAWREFGIALPSWADALRLALDPTE
jgi:dTDP-4-dehydrorhamnose reductase